MQAVSALVEHLLQGKGTLKPKDQGVGFAPVNIALCKYWGKRDTQLNLPVTSSLSIALPEKGAYTQVSIGAEHADLIYLNGEQLAAENAFAERLSAFLNLFRPANTTFKVDTYMNIPSAAGLASSACGFAALVLALDNLFNWQLDKPALSILARLGSGSACRSLWPGFVLWQSGTEPKGLDSFAQPLSLTWPELRIGLLLCDTAAKPLSSRAAMQQTVTTSPFYRVWPDLVSQHLTLIQQVIAERDFVQFGQLVEANALAMHATMQTAWPPIVYSQPQTLAYMQQVWALRAENVPIYFTQDAGPNLKLLFLAEHTKMVQAAFTEMDLSVPFAAQEDTMILVDEQDRAIGFAEKLHVHQLGLRHRAFSVVIIRQRAGQLEVLLQQRAVHKYHGSGLWSNACCSHPRPGEHVLLAAQRRLQEEMNIITELTPKGVFEYRAEFANGLTEHEIDHVFVGHWQADIIEINPDEAAAYRWITIDDLQADLKAHPERYSAWLAEALALALV